MPGLFKRQSVSFPVQTAALTPGRPAQAPLLESAPPSSLGGGLGPLAQQPVSDTSTVPQSPMYGSQQRTISTGSPGLSALADFLTAFGAGVPAGQRQQMMRQQQLDTMIGREQEAGQRSLTLVSQQAAQAREESRLERQEALQRERLGLEERGVRRLERQQETEEKEKTLKQQNFQTSLVISSSAIAELGDLNPNEAAIMKGAAVAALGKQDISPIQDALEKIFSAREIEARRSRTQEDTLTRVLSSIAARNRATPEDIQDMADAVEGGEIEITAVPGNLRGHVIGIIKGQGGTIVSRKQREDLNAFETTLAIVDDIAKVSSKVNTEFGPLALAVGAKRRASAAINLDDDTALLLSKKGELGLLIRGLGEKGVLTEGDVQRAISLMPSIFDSKSLAEKKIASLRALMSGIKKRKLGTLGKKIRPGEGGRYDEEPPVP